MQIKINEEKCIGCEICTQLCPSVINMNLDKAVVTKKTLSEEEIECCQNALEQCPVSAIYLLD